MYICPNFLNHYTQAQKKNEKDPLEKECPTRQNMRPILMRPRYLKPYFTLYTDLRKVLVVLI